MHSAAKSRRDASLACGMTVDPILLTVTNVLLAAYGTIVTCRAVTLKPTLYGRTAFPFMGEIFITKGLLKIQATIRIKENIQRQGFQYR